MRLSFTNAGVENILALTVAFGRDWQTVTRLCGVCENIALPNPYHSRPVSGFFLPLQPDNIKLFTNGYSTAKGYRPIVERGPHECAVTGEKATLNKSGQVAPSQLPSRKVVGERGGFALFSPAPILNPNMCHYCNQP